MNRLRGALFLPILAVACGGGGKGTIKPGLGDGGTTYTPTITTQQFIDQVVGAECDYFVRCGYLPDKSTCLSYIETMSSPDTSSLAYSIDRGRVTLNSTNLPTCLAAFSNLACPLSSSNTSPLAVPCDAVVVGTIASGGDCVFDGECKPGLECDKGSCTASCCPGVCVTAKPISQVGGSCTSNSTCVDTAYCKYSTSGTGDGICQTRAALGAACSDYSGCVANARCIGATGSQTCVTLAQDGEHCSSNSSSGVPCANNASYCDSATGTCQPRLKDNATCTASGAGAIASIDVGCLSFSQCKNGICQRLPLAGDACSNPDAALLDECFLVGKCVGGYCQPNPPKPLCTVASAKAATADAGARD